MAYTTINKSTEHFNTKLYTGNGSAGNAQTGIGFQPDLVWLKSRSDAYAHYWFDAIRGATKQIQSNTTNAETTSANQLTAFNSDGFTLGNDLVTNGSSKTFASWNWKANGAGSANTDGSINSTVSANTTAGFSIVKYDGNATAGATVGHGLGSTPKIIFVKSTTHASDWTTYYGDNTDFLKLNGNNPTEDLGIVWNDTSPTNSVFSLGTYGDVNGSGKTYIAYCFADVTGYSKFGYYVGNGNANGTFIYTGFKPAWLLIKATDSATSESWLLFDTVRQPSNVNNRRLRPNTSDAEDTPTANNVDLLSNGFKIKSSDNRLNGNGQKLIYMAFAEAPLVGTNNVPCTAR